MAEKKNKRRIETFEPCGPIASMIDNETRGKKGLKGRLFQQAIANLLGAKYPKLMQRYEVLREEQAA